jgi:hypothetical protein
VTLLISTSTTRTVFGRLQLIHRIHRPNPPGRDRFSDLMGPRPTDQRGSHVPWPLSSPGIRCYICTVAAANSLTTVAVGPTVGFDSVDERMARTARTTARGVAHDALSTRAGFWQSWSRGDAGATARDDHQT